MPKLNQKQEKKLKKLMQLQSEGELAILEYLFEIEERIEQEVPQITDIISRLKGDKGDQYTITDADRKEIAKVSRLMVNDAQIARKALNMLDLQDIARKASKLVPKPDKMTSQEAVSLVKPFIEDRDVEMTDKLINIVQNEIATAIPTAEKLASSLTMDSERIRDSLELLNGKERLSYTAIDGIEDYEDVKKMAVNANKTVTVSNRRIDQLLDVDTHGITDGQILAYNATSNTYTPVDNTAVGGSSISVNGSEVSDPDFLDSAEIEFGVAGSAVTPSLTSGVKDSLALADSAMQSITDGSITESKLNSSINVSLDLADSALQSGDNISELTNDSGYITSYTETDTLQTVTDRGATSTNTITLSPTGTNSALIANGSGSGSAIDITHAGSGTKLEIGGSGAGDLIVAGTDKFVVEDGGNVGIGTASPRYKLHVDGDALFEADGGLLATFGSSAYQTKYIQIRDGGNYANKWGLQANNNISSAGTGLMISSKSISFKANVSPSIDFNEVTDPHLLIGTDGNIGIGTASPDQKLTLSGDVVGITFENTTGVNSGHYFGTYTSGDRSLLQLSANRRTYDGAIYNTGKAAAYMNIESHTSNSYFTFSTTNTNNANPLERMRIDAEGNVGIGTTSPSTKLEVEVPQGLLNGLTISGPNGGSFGFLNNTSSSNFAPFLGAKSSHNVSGAAGFTIQGEPALDSSTQPAIILRAKDVGGNSATESSPVLQINNWTDELVTVSADGKVGIGTTNPFYKFHVGDSSLPSNKKYFTDATVGFEGTEGAMQFLSAYTGSLAGSIILTAVPTSGDNKHWMIAQGGPNAANRFSISFGETSSNGSMASLVNKELLTISPSTGNVGIGIKNASAKTHIVGTSQQFRSGYDASNYWSATTNASGTTTFNATGSINKFVFTDQVDVTGFFLGIRNNADDNGQIRLQNNNSAGLSGVDFYDNAGALQAGFGYGNASHPFYGDRVFFDSINTAPMAFGVDGNERLQVNTSGAKVFGDVEFDTNAQSIILKSPNNTQYRVSVSNAGALTATAV